MNVNSHPKLVVFSNLFPHSGDPRAGLFIRERMFRVARILPITVIVPIPWFPFQGLIRYFRPHFRPPAPRFEVQQGIDVLLPRFFCIPGFLKQWDGLFMALGCLPAMWRLHRQNRFDIIDAHFAYPNGDAATLLGRWLSLPVTITLRGTEVSLSLDPGRRHRILQALKRAVRVFAVADALRRHVVALGADAEKIKLVGNGVDLSRFYAEDRYAARARLNLPEQALILISVGGLVERKGFHRVIACLPTLLQLYPNLYYLVVGGASPEGDMTAELRQQVENIGLRDHVLFLGAIEPTDLRWPLSAADIFILATRNEGWANVFLEAMACGLPVVTTEVGGNPEVVCSPDLGILVPFGDQEALRSAIASALERHWNRQKIIDYAQSNTWDQRVATLVRHFREIAEQTKQSVD